MKMDFFKKLFSRNSRRYLQEKCPECGKPLFLKSDMERAAYKIPTLLGTVRQITLKKVITQCAGCKKGWSRTEEVETKCDNFDEDVPFYPEFKEWVV